MRRTAVAISVGLICAAVLTGCGAGGESPSTSPTTTRSASASAPDGDVASFYEALVAARSMAESGWPTYRAEQAKCLSLPNRRGNLETFTACYTPYTAAFQSVVRLNTDYVTFLGQAEAPRALAAEFATYYDAVARASTRLSAMYEVFCVEQPHSTLDWYNCVGSNDVSEYWERYFQLENSVADAEASLTAKFSAMGLPDFASR